MRHRLPSSPAPRVALRYTAFALLGLAAALSGCVVAPVGPHYPRPVYRTEMPPPPPAPVAAAPLYFYPARGQTEAMQDRDRYECYRWAVRETGIDPGMTALRAEPSGPVRSHGYYPPRADGADVVAGAATGAILGAAVSSPRNAGPNAVIGAIFGAAIGAAAGEARNRAIDEAQARAEARQAAATERSLARSDHFRRAMSACMSGRGYQVE